MSRTVPVTRHDTQPRDSGEFLPVPIRYITLPVAPPAPGLSTPYGSRIAPPPTPARSQFWPVLCLAVPPLQAGFAAAMVWAAATWLDWLPGPILMLLVLALPSLAAAPVAGLFALGFAPSGPSWRERASSPALLGLALWIVVVPAWIVAADRIHGPADIVWGVVGGGLAGGFLAVVSMPGMLVGLALLARLVRPIVRRRQRQARARHWLIQGWKAP